VALKLPDEIISRNDVVRLVRELASLDDFLLQAKLRKPGESMTLPRLSRLLEDTAAVNSLNLLTEKDRIALTTVLVEVRDKAPQVHISFATDPSSAFMKKIVVWFRTEVHPVTLVQVGLQPSIAAGCTLRTTNHYIDMSLRNSFVEKQSVLVELLRKETV